MKKIFVFFVALFGAAMMLIGLISCSKKGIEIQRGDTRLAYEIPVFEQQNVSHYEILLSSDGKEYDAIETIFATENEQQIYTIEVNIQRYLSNNQSVVYTMIKSIDIDGNYNLSKVLTAPLK